MYEAPAFLFTVKVLSTFWASYILYKFQCTHTLSKLPQRYVAIIPILYVLWLQQTFLHAFVYESK